MRDQQLNGSQVPATQPVSSKKKKVKKPFGQEDEKPTGCLQRLQRKDSTKDGNEKNQTLRHVVIDTAKLPNTLPENNVFCTNRISTTKYNYLTFLPKSLIIQFLRVSNVYFLITAILTSIPGFSPLPSYTSIIPLTFVLTMSMLREAYEDYKRRVNDRLTNNKKSKVLHGAPLHSEQNRNQQFDAQDQLLRRLDTNERNLQHIKENFSEKLWADIKCGDIILVEEGEHFPADIVILNSSAENGECFVQTSTLDGERALKHKQCLVPIKKAIDKDGFLNFHCSILSEPPTKNLYEVNAYMETDQFPEFGTVQLNLESKKRTVTLDSKQVALRGSNLANTAWVIGAVIYTGRETKLMQNQGLSRFKQSKIEKVVNVICIYLILLQTALCIIMSIYSGFYTSNYASLSQDGLRRKAEYLFYTELSPQVKQTNTTNTDDLTYNPTIIGVQTYGSYYILLNTLIPISLVVSIEFVKLIQTPFFAHDLNMYDEESMKQAQPMTMTLHEELASVKYIFADKTGTLTANIMQFKACTIGSVCYDEDYNEDDYEYEIELESTERGQNQQSEEEKLQDFIDDIRGDGEIKAIEFEQFKESKGYPFNQPGGVSQVNRNDSMTKIVWNFKESTQIIKNLLETKKYFMNEEINLGRSQIDGTDVILKKQNEYLHMFWLNVILCHDVITTKKEDSDSFAYQGTSPDEITLLDAAKEVGYIFLDRNSDSIKVEVFGKQKEYKLLQKLEFTSERKKMSVVVKDQETGVIMLLSKGADLAIFERLSTSLEQPFLEATKEDLIKFSTKGFRTLCFSVRVLDENSFADWKIRYENSKLEMIKLGLNKLKQETVIDNLTEKLQNELEKDLFLLGATALEDKLQDGVPEAIDDFHHAGIKVWMLTGDKLETAENIGFSSKMFNEKMYIFKLQTKTKNETRERLKQIDLKIADIEKSHAMPIIGTQFILNPNAGQDLPLNEKEQITAQLQEFNEAKNIIRALEEYKHESRASEFTLNDSWARKPTLKRKVRKRLEEIVPDKQAIVSKLIRENQIFYKQDVDHFKYIPNSFDMGAKQYIVRTSNIYRSASSMKNKPTNRDIIDNEDTFGILVEGQALQFLIDSESMRKKFLKILAKCQAVIVCRASPSQKGLVVQMIQKSEPDVITLAIGDGANDVNMIQKAHIGIGIFGKEGYQAAGNSDYAIGQFRFLRRLMFVHGRWSGVRLSFFMLFFFHKNIVFTMQQFWFGWYNGFSGQTYYDDVYLTCFNTFVTAIAICALAVSDQDINVEDKSKKDLIEAFFPFIYKESQQNDLFTKKKFLVWAAISILQSILIFGVPIVTYDSLMLHNGRLQDMWAVSTCSYFGVVILHYFLILCFTKNWTLWISAMYVVSFLLFAPFVILTYNSFPNTFMEGRLGEIVFNDGFFWLMIIVLVSCCIVPIMFYYEAQVLLFPSLKDLILQGRLNKNKLLKELDPVRARQAHELFKAKQQAQLNQWHNEYNNFALGSPQNIIEGQLVEELGSNDNFLKIPKNGKLDGMLSDTPEKYNHQSMQRRGLSASELMNSPPEGKKHMSRSFQANDDVLDERRIVFDIQDCESFRSENLREDTLLQARPNLDIRMQMYSEIFDEDLQPESAQIPLSTERRNPSKMIFKFNEKNVR